MSKKTPKKTTEEAPTEKEYINATKRDIFTSKGRVRPDCKVTLDSCEVEGLKVV